MSRLPALLCAFAALSFVPVAVAAPPASREIAAVLNRPAFQNASVGVCVRSLKTGKIVFEQNANVALVPASNMKLLTGLVALKTLGAGFRYTTRLYTNAAPDASGTVTGDVFLRGSGDPSLSSARLDALAVAVKNAGIKRIVGRIVGDGTAFDANVLGAGWQWDDEPFYYSPQVSGLNCDGNVAQIGVRPGATTGETAMIFVNNRPVGEETFLSAESRVRTVAAGGVAAVSFDRTRGANRVLVSGTIAAGAKEQTEAITVEDPARFTASRFVLALIKAGVAVDTPLYVDTGATPTGATEIATSVSEPLAKLVADFLKPSDNLFGEALLKTVGAVTNVREPGSVGSGATALAALLRGANIGTGGLHIADGSGLSLQNTVTPRLLCDLLAWADTIVPADRAVFQNALPVGGVDGTLRNRFKNTPLAGNVRAKTGTLFGASSLSGYVAAKSGERFAFSILMNHYANGASKAREAQDALVTALYNAR